MQEITLSTARPTECLSLSAVLGKSLSPATGKNTPKPTFPECWGLWVWHRDGNRLDESSGHRTDDRMSWLSRLTPRGQGSRANQNTAPSSPVTADPETCLIVFQNHWRQVSWVFEQQDCRGSGVGDDLTAVQNHTDQMMCLLAEERRPGGGASTGPILELVLKENVLDRLLQWHLRRGMSPDSQRALLKLFEVLIGQCQQPLLQHKAVLQPVLCLLATCADPVLGCLPALEGSLVLLLNQVCVCMAQQPGVLELLLHATPLHAHQSPSPQLIFSLLVPFIHREGSTGQQARDALLLVMATSASNQAVARYITENSYFCQILAAGLSALYSSLPRKLDVRDDDWHALRHEDWAGVSSLVLFMNSLEFCNAVVQVSHPLVRGQLLDFIHSGFLEPVIGPALHKSSVEEMIASTAYLDLFLRSVTETDLLKTFLRFVLLDRHDDDTILDTLLARISSNSRLCMVSLSLFRTLLSLNCEDLVLQLILRYLLPCTHVMLSQRPAVRETDMYGKSADKFLSLIPECCRLDTAPPGDREDDDAQWGRAQESPSMESAVPPKPRTQSHLALFMRQLGNGPDRTSAHPRRDSNPMTTDSRLQWASEAAKGLDWEGQYLAYLRDARKGIELCSWGCRDWSAPYDGENPSPNSAPPPPPPPTPIPALIMVPEHFSLNPVAVSTPPPAALSAAPIPTVPSGQQGAEAVSPQRSSSDQDGGKWNVTIDKKCVSLTSHASKRSLQQLAPVKHEAPPPPPASTAQMPLPLASSPHHALCNGVGLGEEVPHSQDEGMEEKKLKRELSDGCSPADGGHNGATGGPPESCQVVSSVLSQGTRPQLAPAMSQGLESVESLIRELMDRTPISPQSEDSGGHGISIEAFHQELQELEDRVLPLREHPQDPAPGPVPASTGPEGEPAPIALDSEAKPEDSANEVFSSAHSLRLPLSQPYTGPLMGVVFAKLECMLQNSLYVNIMLTGILAKLACYPQPLLRSFLLNTNMVFQPSVKSLVQVLGSVKIRIEAFAATQENFPAMLRKARQYLVARGKLDWADPLGLNVHNLRRSDSLVKSRKTSLGNLILRHTQSPTRARQVAQQALANVHGGAQGQAEALRVKNAVYSAVVFSEFLKELAALAQEHAVAMPFPHSQGAEE
ncbi:hypothetical protein SKAU_G00252940 [Synaphobranchus kaupii]|uniref:FHF complex subunit HOOK-interacting protein 1B n=1 Tax=Synaphobranchus kaupii TaxID=118154 RepID=A0A9Q1IPZ2_SYNKA|nr:hypothetical protein SKAU_G00252940 [Synaphobranchus kaupii]